MSSTMKVVTALCLRTQMYDDQMEAHERRCGIIDVQQFSSLTTRVDSVETQSSGSGCLQRERRSSWDGDSHMYMTDACGSAWLYNMGGRACISSRLEISGILSKFESGTTGDIAQRAVITDLVVREGKCSYGCRSKDEGGERGRWGRIRRYFAGTLESAVVNREINLRVTGNESM
ncbi:hypothetical protein BDR05DRAFT_945068 [Suillus weaverae]|nr:hypothetical protein BDR05DRAFT_945068 [Suillus weaverae]